MFDGKFGGKDIVTRIGLAYAAVADMVFTEPPPEDVTLKRYNPTSVPTAMQIRYVDKTSKVKVPSVILSIESVIILSFL